MDNRVRTKILQRIEVLKRYADDPSATEEEKSNALRRLHEIQEKYPDILDFDFTQKQQITITNSITNGMFIIKYKDLSITVPSTCSIYEATVLAEMRFRITLNEKDEEVIRNELR